MMSLNILRNILAKINKVSWMGKQILLEDTGHTVAGVGCGQKQYVKAIQNIRVNHTGLLGKERDDQWHCPQHFLPA